MPNKNKTPKPTAYWNVSLSCECPKCKKYVDFLEYPDFWTDRSSLEICERKEITATCPECKEEVEVQCLF